MVWHNIWCKPVTTLCQPQHLFLCQDSWSNRGSYAAERLLVGCDIMVQIGARMKSVEGASAPINCRRLSGTVWYQIYGLTKLGVTKLLIDVCHTRAVSFFGADSGRHLHNPVGKAEGRRMSGPVSNPMCLSHWVSSIGV